MREVAALFDDDDTFVADRESLTIGIELETDPGPLGNDHVLVDDAAMQPYARADRDVREDDRVGDVSIVVDERSGPDDRALDVRTGDDRSLTQQAAVDE